MGDSKPERDTSTVSPCRAPVASSSFGLAIAGIAVEPPGIAQKRNFAPVGLFLIEAG